MAENSQISWTDHTFNPWIGCAKVAPGCEHCYAEAFAKRYNKAKWGPKGTRVKTSEAYWRQPLKWNREAECNCGAAGHGGAECDFCQGGCRRPRVFCASLADVFEEWNEPIVNSEGRNLKKCDSCRSISPDGLTCASCGRQTTARDLTLDDLRRDLFALIDSTPHVDWLLLTKRPENVRRMWPEVSDKTRLKDGIYCFEHAPGRRDEMLYRENVWLGTSVSDQATADRNVPELLKCRDFAPVLFVSAEPLLGPVNLRLIGETTTGIRRPDGSFRPLMRYDALAGHEDLSFEAYGKIDWVIAGGESGPHRRPMQIGWVQSLADQCDAAGVPLFVKQSSALRSGSQGDIPDSLWKIKEFPNALYQH